MTIIEFGFGLLGRWFQAEVRIAYFSFKPKYVHRPDGFNGMPGALRIVWLGFDLFIAYKLKIEDEKPWLKNRLKFSEPCGIKN